MKGKIRHDRTTTLAFTALRRFDDDAEREYNIALRLRPDAQIRLEALRSHSLRLLELADYDRACQASKEARDLAPDDILQWRRLAITQLASNQVEESLETCLLMFERFRASSNKNELLFLTWACTLHPEFATSSAEFTTVADAASRWWLDSEQILVAVHDRKGEYAQALRSLKSSAQVADLWNTPRFFEAMALYQIGERDVARAKLVEALRAPRMGDWEGNVAADTVREEAELLILRRSP